MSNETLYRNIFATIMLVTIIVGYDVAHTPTEIAIASDVVASPSPISEVSNIKVGEVVTTEYKPTPKPAETPEEYIKEVFGEHADKAFLLLKGNGVGSCAENRTLDQNAKNRNWIKDKPGEYWSTDWGIFQINDHFHPVEELNLRTDFKANIDYAWRMYKNNGYSFERWTCGRIYGI